jgi:hypothetical protein
MSMPVTGSSASAYGAFSRNDIPPTRSVWRGKEEDGILVGDAEVHLFLKREDHARGVYVTQFSSVTRAW